MSNSVFLTVQLQLKLIFALTCAVVLTACTTTDLKKAQLIAKAGQNATQSVETNLDGLSKQAINHVQIFAFTTTLEDCENEPVCTPWDDTASLAELYGQYSSHVERRKKATMNLRLAYDAMLADAETDARGKMEESVGNAVTSVTNHATKLLPGSKALTEILTNLIQQVAGLKAQNDQAQRLKSANDTIAIATALMSAALEAELDTHNAIDTDIDSYRDQFRAQLIRTGVITQVDILKELAKSADIKIESNLAPLIRSNSKLQVALQASKMTRDKVNAAKKANSTTPADTKAAKSAYAKAIKTLSGMSKKHEMFGELKENDWQRLRTTIAEIQRTRGIVSRDNQADGEKDAE